MPFFSIIIPAYNLEKYIHCAINSIINQKYQDYEVIIVDDCSTDNTLNIITGYEDKYKNITVFKHSENQTQHIARMNGVNIAKGKYILFLDGDDSFTEDAFSILFNVIQNNPYYDFYEFGYIRQPSCKVIFPSFKGDDRFSAYFSIDKYPAHTMWNKVYETSLLKKAFLLMEREYINHTEDLYESIIISYYAKKILTTNIIVINYNENIGISNISDNYNSAIKCLQSSNISLNLIQLFLNKINYNISLTSLNNRIIEYVLENYKNKQYDSESIKNIYKELFKIFNNEALLDYLAYREKKLKEIKLLSNSLDYRLGQKILLPLRILKRLFRKKYNGISNT